MLSSLDTRRGESCVEVFHSLLGKLRGLGLRVGLGGSTTSRQLQRRKSVETKCLFNMVGPKIVAFLHALLHIQNQIDVF